MLKKPIKIHLQTALCLLLFSSSAFAKDIKFLEAAYEDGLYLFVEKNAAELLDQKDIQDQKVIVDKLQLLWVASLVSRHAYVDALARLDKIEATTQGKLSPKLKYYKAISLFYVYVKEGEPLPEDVMSPHDLLVQIEMQLDTDLERKTSKFYRAWDLYEQGEYNRSSDLLNLLASGLIPDELGEKVKYLFARSLFYSNPPQYEKSQQILKELIGKYKTSKQMARYYFWKAECFFELNQLQEAEMAYREVLNHQPDTSAQVDVHYNLGWLYASMGELNKATQHLETLLQPAWKEAAKHYRAASAYKLANIYLLLDLPGKTLNAVGAVLNDEALKYHGHLVTGEAYLKLEAWDEAVNSLSLAMGSPTTNIRLKAERKLAIANLNLKKYDLALQGLKKLINTEDPLPLDYRIQIQLDLAKVYLEMGDVYVAQNIYRDLLKEKSKNIEAGINYHLAKCAMQTNPLVSCIYERDHLSRKLREGRISSDDYQMQRNALKVRVSSVLSRIWTMANEESKLASQLSKQEVIAVLGAISETNIENLLQELEDKHFEEYGDLPSTMGQESSMFISLSEKFVTEVFFSKEKLPDYQSAREILKPVSNVFIYLQIKPISDHLNEVISLGKKSPYLALAYRDKADLHKDQDLPGVVLENLFHAIQSTTDPKLKSQYLLELTNLHIEEAQKLVQKSESNASGENDIVDPKTQKFKVVQALNYLDEILALDNIAKVTITKLQHQCHLIMTDYESAERVLTEFLNSSEPHKDLVEIEALLIQFYLDHRMDRAAAQQRILHAERIEASNISDAHKHRYLAALEFLNQNDLQKKAYELLQALAAYQPRNTWTYKAALKQAEVFQKTGKTAEAAKLLTVLKNEQSKDMPETLVYEWNMIHGRLALQQNDYKLASQYFKRVYDMALPQHEVKSVAMLEYAKALKQLNAEKASDVYLQFYYQFAAHDERETALLKSCELKLQAISSYTQPDSKLVAKRQLQKLITKLASDTERVKLMDQVKSL